MIGKWCGKAPARWPAADADVDRVDAGGVRAHEDDVRPDRRLGEVVDDPQDRLVAEPVVDGGPHRRPFT